MKRVVSLLSLLIISFLSRAQGTASPTPEFLIHYNKTWVDSIFNTLSVEEKIGQLLMPRGNFSGKGYDPEKLKQWVRDYKIGGLVMFAGQPTVQAGIINELQALSKTPMLIGMDLEWGLAMRLDSAVRFPYQMTLGAMQGNKALIERMGMEVAKQCKRLGVHINYAPVVDINNNPNNPVINFRSFGEDKLSVSQKALAYMKGMQSQHLLTAAKHFPGHGDTGVDSHLDLPVISKDKKSLDDLELYPYKVLIANGLSGIMTAHLNIPALDTTQHLAATFSKNIVTDLMRKELGFKGLSFTDAMDMQGAVKYFPNGQALVKAILAGNDVLETFLDVPTAFDAIKRALTSGEISQAVIDERVRRILMAKSWVGLDHYQPTVLKHLVEDLNTPESDLLNREMAEASITLVKNEQNILPIQDLTQKIACVSIDADTTKLSDFQKMVANYTQVDNFTIPANASDAVLTKVLSQLKSYDLVVVGLHLTNIRPAAKYGINEANKKALKALLNANRVVLSIFGNPYSLDKLEDLDKAQAIVMGYQETNYMEEATAQAIFGAIPFVGKLPVGVNQQYVLNQGISTSPIGRLAYGTPDMVGLDAKTLRNNIDSVVNVGLQAKAFPGCVVEIAKNGRVIYQKAFGYQTYQTGNSLSNSTPVLYQNNNKNDVMDERVTARAAADMKGTTVDNANNKVQLNDLYDLASVTKVSTSLLAIMQLMSEGKFDLDKTFKDYYPDFKGSNKADLRFRDMLTHKAGLKAWIPFWMDCIDSVATVKNSVAFKEKYAQQFHQNIFQRIFHPKSYNVAIAQAIQKDKNLWKDCLRPETMVWKPNTFATTPSADYPIRVAEKLWIHKDYSKKIYDAIRDSPVKPQQGYVYSDLHYYLYPLMIPKIIGEDWETYLKKTYRQIGATTLTYNPLRFYSPNRIVPTELDTLFRKNLIHGLVHDEGAAMLNGISGHAGLFGTANDLTKLMTLYLQKGSFGGKQFIKPEVIAECTKYQFPELKNRRAIAFDKLDFNEKITNGPRSASAESYGHSGFTGTFTWIDPKYDLVYVFLSNRVYPTRNNNKISDLNTRTEVMEQVYKQLKK